MNCKACRVEIETIERDEPLSRTAGEHIEACAACRSFRDERYALREMIGSLEVVSAPADFDFRLRARLAAVKSEGQRGFLWQRFAPGARSLALAASFIVMITGGLLIRQAWRAPSASTTSIVPNSQMLQTSPSAGSAVSPTPEELRRESSPAPVRDGFPVRTLASSKENIKRNVRREPGVVNSLGVDEVVSRDSSVRQPPPSNTPPGIPDPVTQPGAMIGMPVSASLKSAKVNLDDGRAKPQFLSLRPVTFGAQEVIEEKGAQKHLILRPQGIW